MSEPAIKEDLARIEASATKAHERLDEVIKDNTAMREDVGEIKGCVTPMSDDVRLIKEALLKPSSNGSGNTRELFKTIRWLLVVLVIGCMVIGGMTQFKASNSSGTVEVGK